MKAEYHPDFSALRDVCAQQDVGQLLIVGGDEAVAIGVAAQEIRATSDAQPALQNGVYVYPRAGDSAVVMAVRQGQRAGELCIVDMLTDVDHPAARTYMWFGHLWGTAQPVQAAPLFSVGDVCTFAGDASKFVKIIEVSRSNGENRYLCQDLADPTRCAVETSEPGLKPIEVATRPSAAWLSGRPVGASELAVGVTTTKITNPLTDTVYSYLSSKTVFRPYQFRPVLKFLESPRRRLLIADEVGLGKTIEAGLIWSELEARDRDFNRVLIVCPAALRTKWREEMSRRFDREARIVNSSQILDLLKQVDDEGDERGFYAIASIETIRSLSVQEELQNIYPMIDLVIVDEAHIMRNSTTSSHSAGMLLGSLARALVFLSATPINLRHDDLFHLLQILVPDEFASKTSFLQQVEPNRFVNSAAQLLRRVGASPRDVASELTRVNSAVLGANVSQRWEYERVIELCASVDEFTPPIAAEVKRHLASLNTFSSVITRTRKIDVPQDKAVREAREIHVELTPAEATFLKQVNVRIRATAEQKYAMPGFASQMPLRQAASCLPVMIDRVRRGDHDWELTDEELADADDYDFIDEDGDFRKAVTRQRSWIARTEHALEATDGASDTPLIELAEPIGDVDSKFDAFLRCLRQAEEIGSNRVMVFSFFRGTLEYLHRRLSEEGIECRVMHGGVPVADRDSTIRAFRNDDFQILLSSEVGSEGLDFEFCNVIVNYDLPWNPMKVEQRIGRLDRFGQTNDKIFIFNFQIPGTIETEIFSRLYSRIRVFEQSIGELEPILRDEVIELSRVALDPELSEEQRIQRTKDIADAVEERRLQLEELESDTTLVNGAGNALIDGFEDDPERGGRFVGPLELLELLRRYARATRQLRIAPGSTPNRSLLVGSPELATAIRRRRMQRSGSRYSTNELAAMLDDETAFEVTISNEDASRTNTDLLSIRHPVVQAAAAHFGELPASLWRFASVKLPNDGAPTQRSLVALYLVQTTGIRPRLEIWPIAATADGGDLVSGVGEALLSAIAQGSLSDGSPVVSEDLSVAYNAVDDAMFRRSEQDRAKAARDNDAEVNRQISIQRAKVRAECTKRQHLLEDPNLDERMRRMHEGSIRIANERLDEVIGNLEQRRGLTLTTEPLAFVLVDARNELANEVGESR